MSSLIMVCWVILYDQNIEHISKFKIQQKKILSGHISNKEANKDGRHCWEKPIFIARLIFHQHHMYIELIRFFLVKLIWVCKLNQKKIQIYPNLATCRHFEYKILKKWKKCPEKYENLDFGILFHQMLVV